MPKLSSLVTELRTERDRAQKELEQLTAHKGWLKKFPIKEMKKRSWLPDYVNTISDQMISILNFLNYIQDNNMGMPLPEGIIRVMKRDKDGSFEFVGEDRIQHTPRDEKLTVKVGDPDAAIIRVTIVNPSRTQHGEWLPQALSEIHQSAEAILVQMFVKAEEVEKVVGPVIHIKRGVANGRVPLRAAFLLAVPELAVGQENVRSEYELRVLLDRLNQRRSGAALLGGRRSGSRRACGSAQSIDDLPQLACAFKPGVFIDDLEARRARTRAGAIDNHQKRNARAAQFLQQRAGEIVRHEARPGPPQKLFRPAGQVLFDVHRHNAHRHAARVAVAESVELLQAGLQLFGCPPIANECSDKELVKFEAGTLIVWGPFLRLQTLFESSY